MPTLREECVCPETAINWNSGLTTSFTAIQQWVATGFKSKEQVAEEAAEMHDKYNEERRVMGLSPLPKLKAEDEKKA